MDSFDISDSPEQQRRRRILISILFEAAREALQVFASAVWGLLCQWLSFILVIAIQVAPGYLVIRFYLSQWPDIFERVHWLILLVPVIITVYISRSLFTLVLQFFHYLAQKTWGRVYARRIPSWMMSRQLQSTTRHLGSSFSDIPAFYSGILWVFRQIRNRLAQSEPQEAICSTCMNLYADHTMHYSSVVRSARRCATCATLCAGVCRFYPPRDLTNPFYYQWNRYHDDDEILMHWDENKKFFKITLKNIVSFWPIMTFYSLGGDSHLPLISSPRAAVDDTRSESTMHRVQSWITKCTTEHEHCGTSEPKPLPDRVLDLGDSFDLPIKLIETRNEPGHYACLSHCWGPVQPLRTLGATKDAFMAGIPTASLPRTFQDAAMTCRQLSIRYLWIDSLCIVQDSVDEWERQLPKMANIYENAYLTIAATKAKGHQEGLHPDKKSRPVLIERIPAQEIGHGLSEDVFVCLEYLDNGGVKHWDLQEDQASQGEWPLLTRAWVFQERLLSPRMLHFTQRELVWECRTAVLCDCGRKRDAKTPDELEFRRLVCSQSLKTTNATPTQLRELWYSIVERYSALMGNLTVESDAFPALAGLASRISGLLGDDYIAGLWRGHMVEGLLWACANQRPNHTPGRPQRWRAPSWSWASVTKEVSYKQSTSTLYSWAKPQLHEVYASVVGVECTPTGSQRTGPISSAVLTLSGCVSHATIRVRRNESRDYYTGEVTEIDLQYDLVWQHDGHESQIRPDHPEDVVDGEAVICLRLARIDKRDWYLALVRSGQSTDTYKRLGLYEGGDVTWKWTSVESWQRRAEQRYHEEKRVLRIV